VVLVQFEQVAVPGEQFRLAQRFGTIAGFARGFDGFVELSILGICSSQRA
jgi:hypothetical protein